MIVPLKLPLEGIAAERFLALARQLKQLQFQRNKSDFQMLCNSEINWARLNLRLNSGYDMYEAACRVLIDLARLNWNIQESGFGIELLSPGSPIHGSMSREAIHATKLTVRRELEPLRNAQFANQSVRDFITSIEAPSLISKKKPIGTLIADGRELHSRLGAAIAVQGEQRSFLLAEAVKPYLQLIEPGVKDRFTGILLGDIWRYFRYSWAIPQTSFPGRQLLYLVRDAAHESHAIMGIAGLNNGAMQMKARDDVIGWTLSAYERYVSAAIHHSDTAQIFLDAEYTYLSASLETALASIDPTHLVTPEQLGNPSVDLIYTLRRRSGVFAAQRGELLKNLTRTRDEPPDTVEETEAGEYGAPPVSDEVLELEGINDSPQMKEARRMLFAKKRAFELARLLQAKRTLGDCAERFQNPTLLPDLFRREDFQIALNTIFGAIKSVHVGSNMLELTTCGAVSPYNGILAGKLTALLMLSPEVAADYKSRYGGEASIIKSQLKNALVSHDTSLVYLGTTSLYAAGSSQYERVRLPAGIISTDQSELRFQCIGETSGYGTVQFMPETVRALEKVLEHDQGFKHVNSIFGEGPSPRLRKLNAGFRLLGFDPEHLLKHNQKRLIYAAVLCKNALGFLCGRDIALPAYITHPEHYRDAGSRIADYWRQRWLASRLNHAHTLVELSLTKTWRLSEHIPVTSTPHEDHLTSSVFEGGIPMNKGSEAVTFWRNLAQSGAIWRREALMSLPMNCTDALRYLKSVDLKASILRISYLAAGFDDGKNAYRQCAGAQQRD